MKSTLTVMIGSTLLVAGSAIACPYSDGKEMTYLEHDQKEQSMVGHDQQPAPHLLVELQGKKETATN